MKILVTGAAGFIGSHLAERLAAAGHHVTGLDCYTDFYPRWMKEQNASEAAKAGVSMISLDLASDGLAEAVEGVEVIFHFAAQPGISGKTAFETYVRNNITATYRLLEAVKDSAGLRCLVNIATSSVYGAHAADTEEAAPRPTSYYGVTKLAAEQLAMAYFRECRMPVCSLRLFSVYGPRERPEKLYPMLIGSILSGKALPLYGNSLKHLRSFTYVDDVVDCCEAVLSKADKCVGEVFNVGWDRETTTAEAIAIVEEIVGRKASYVNKPPRAGDQLRTCANIDKARRILGYQPKMTLKKGLEIEVKWFREKMLPMMKEHSGTV
ncbi:MAG TPA: NAD-dependent epimerase/dehydratase family protein [Sedimentisphaerales bacterium]|nr:NAD-dependent epimerase/dehydratase family protein [Sedimentisphaerales bacterium]